MIPVTLEKETARRMAEATRFVERLPSFIGMTPGGAPKQMFDVSNPSFWCYVTVDGTTPKLKITGGTIQYLYNAVQVDVSLSGFLAPSDGDKAWLQYDGSNTWTFHVGADWPTDKIYFALVGNIAVDGGTGAITISDDDRLWEGGDLVFSEVFPVTVEQSSGADNPKYLVKTLNDVQILSDNYPVNERLSGYKWQAGTKGVAYLKPDGAFEFYVFDEYRKNIVLDQVVLSVEWTGTELKQNVVANVAVQDYDSMTYGDATIDTPDTCP